MTTKIHSAKLVSTTPDAEKNIAYCARVSTQTIKMATVYLIIVLSISIGLYLRWHL